MTKIADMNYLPAYKACGTTTIDRIRVRCTPLYMPPTYDYDTTTIVPLSSLQHDAIHTYDDTYVTHMSNVDKTIKSVHINTSYTTDSHP